MYLFDKLDLKILKGISIVITLAIKMSGTSISFLFCFDIRFMNVEYSLNLTAEPTYCFKHLEHIIRYITSMLSQLSWPLMKQDFPVTV